MLSLSVCLPLTGTHTDTQRHTCPGNLKPSNACCFFSLLNIVSTSETTAVNSSPNRTAVLKPQLLEAAVQS